MNHLHKQVFEALHYIITYFADYGGQYLMHLQSQHMYIMYSYYLKYNIWT
jgi:hypothetical protein